MNTYRCTVHYLDNHGHPARHETQVEAPDEAVADRVARRRVARRWGSYFREVVRVEISKETK